MKLKAVLAQVILASLCSTAFSDDGETAYRKMISDAADLQMKYERAASVFRDVHLGGGYDTFRLSEFNCVGIGIKLGKQNLVNHLIRFEKPELKVSITWDDAYQYLRAAKAFENFVEALQYAETLSSNDREKIWNIDCAGMYNIPKLHVAPSKSNANFRYEAPYFVVLGSIERGFYDEFMQEIRKYRNIEAVALGSGGGNIAEAIKVGREIRRRGLNTTLHNNCKSACTLVFLGGVERRIIMPYPKLGFHEASRDGVAIKRNDPTYEYIAAYAQDMGVNPKFVLNAMWSSPPTSMNYIKLDKLCEPGVATWVQRIC